MCDEEPVEVLEDVDVDVPVTVLICVTVFLLVLLYEGDAEDVFDDCFE